MKSKKNLSETYLPQGYTAITIKNLDCQFCNICGDGFYSLKSEKIIKATMAEEKARQDSGRTVASELIEIETMASLLSISRQRVHQMMDEGKIRYVFVGKLRFPVKETTLRSKIINRKEKKNSVKNPPRRAHR